MQVSEVGQDHQSKMHRLIPKSDSLPWAAAYGHCQRWVTGLEGLAVHLPNHYSSFCVLISVKCAISVSYCFKPKILQGF